MVQSFWVIGNSHDEGKDMEMLGGLRTPNLPGFPLSPAIPKEPSF